MIARRTLLQSSLLLLATMSFSCPPALAQAPRRNLNDTGREELKQLRDAFKQLGIPVGSTLSIPIWRCRTGLRKMRNYARSARHRDARNLRSAGIRAQAGNQQGTGHSQSNAGRDAARRD
ncbi:MAG: hypothetical protein WKF77_10270 [Planctomycetaceae bacterium]